VTEPQVGDVLLRGDTRQGFQIVDAISHEILAASIPTLEAAIETARRHGASAIWQQSLDNRGRPLGDPFRFLRPAEK
jgi:hypothetical protein